MTWQHYFSYAVIWTVGGTFCFAAGSFAWFNLKNNQTRRMK